MILIVEFIVKISVAKLNPLPGLPKVMGLAVYNRTVESGQDFY
jgi:hypothetical protein